MPPGFELVGFGDAATFRNTDRAHITGLEYQLMWQPKPSTQIVLNQAFVNISSADIGARFSRSAPAHSLSLLAIQRFPRDYTGSLGFYRVGAMEWLGDGDAVDGYDRLDLRLAKKFHGARHEAELALTLQGLLGSYPEAADEQFFTRRGFVTFSLGF
ncbi:MAG: TonB-dependent receptor [Burkholderiales bacterium]|nr:TonB-dependent receptor [Burkholderiales bacterium]